MFKTIGNIYLFHKYLLNNNLNYDEIKIIRNKTLFDYDDFNIKFLVKNIYQTVYYYIINFNLYINVFNYKKLIDDKKYIQNIINSQDLDMSEVRTKTTKALDNKPNLYYGVMKWISGCSWSNCLITNGYDTKLLDIDIEIINSINKTVELVEPISKPLILFHGFEKFTNYKENELVIGKKYNFPGILSKTSKFEIAQKFSWGQNFVQSKYFIIYYPTGSKHIGLDIKPQRYDEYEYITKQNENFEIKQICKIFNGFRLEIFYICESIDY